MMQAILQDLLPQFRLPVFELQEASGQVQLHLLALLMQPLQIGHRVVSPAVVAHAQVTLGAFWQPVALAAATAAVWPRRIQQNGPVPVKGVQPPKGAAGGFIWIVPAVLAAVIAALAATILSAFLAPSLLAGMIVGQAYWHEASDQIAPHIVRLPRFLEEGGSLMLAILVGALGGDIGQRMFGRVGSYQ